MTAFLKVDRIALRFGGVQICKESGSLDAGPRVLNNSSKDHGEEAGQVLSKKVGVGANIC